VTDRPKDKRVVNVSELTPPGAAFVDFGQDVIREDYSAIPRNKLEAIVKRPKLSRYRAAVEAVRAARGMPIISHLPRMTAAVSTLQRLTGDQSPHLAFSFNFTELPSGAARRYLANAFSRVRHFFVFSEFERHLYPHYFGLDGERFHYLSWTQEPPPVASTPSPFALNSYVSAVGGEGRDYATLIAAARLLPDIAFLIIARPYNRLGEMPPNVRLLTDVPLEQTWRIAADSSCLVVPLRDRTTCCGHITLVAGELLGIPVISTRSDATTAYTEDIALCLPGDVEALAGLIRQHHDSAPVRKAAAMARIPGKRAKYDRRIWEVALRKIVEDLDRR
jgi:glycosyltransferase involved in cell wall biosynthesis